MTEHHAVVDSILTRPRSAAEVLRELLDLAEGGRLELKEFASRTPGQLLSGHLPPQFIPTGPRQITVTFEVLEGE